MSSLFSNIKSRLIEFYFMRVKSDSIAYARHLGVRIGSDCQLLVNPRSAFGTEPWLISLGNHVDVTADVHFISHEGALWCVRWLVPEYKMHDMFKPTIVGDNVMIGIGSLIMPGVTIGNNVVIAGHSVVTKDIPDGAIVAGVPAKQISSIDDFIKRLKTLETFETKSFTSEQKRAHLKNIHPEWF